MMWEWRIFYTEEDTPSWAASINELLKRVPMENRIDLYYDLRTIDFGLKIRAFSEDFQLLELKVLEEKKGDYEYWEKPIKRMIRYEENSLDLENIISQLKKKYPRSLEILKISEIIKNQKIREMKIKKSRKKNSFNGLSIESVKLSYQQKEMLGVQFEGNSINTIKDFMKNNIEITTSQYKNTSYPRLLMEL